MTDDSSSRPADSARGSAPHPPPPPGQEGRYFGFREVDPAEKSHLVHDVFTNVAAKYDLMNDVMSAGIHRLWKDSFVSMVRPRDGETLLDVAGGTGDIAFRLRSAAPAARVMVCDLTEGMVRVGRDRALDRGDLHGVEWTVGNAEKLPFRSRSVDAYTIAFGLRNVTDIDAALKEARRVLKPGGRLFILEFSHVVIPLMREAYDAYSFNLLPTLGQLVAGDRDSYQYLVESIRRFPEQQALCQRIEAAGLARARYRNLTGGIAAIHSAWRV
ncbi:bifunctional demethylmenaquinone methyltransferase/2-methoxy-6-polyprenyl-1,4-benzoquinol methylase UbiE [Indioceanicola profundi]|uniref:bifunctional demethylmenaquinone methyltransferase/2-methoxy-6-polyprenyl-1,4-benzoquinol methylase UbiE n=1 Tax=Indioceanicola profundi TaxID=2220096 RepID=UPI000E6AA8A4|nr:bifunctional demethylmenaquinone methyltransferase/2-methoxy-6-polyprenyl-1,4-benzoquinol methylase UbiE [Indioceanicola profundi]